MEAETRSGDGHNGDNKSQSKKPKTGREDLLSFMGRIDEYQRRERERSDENQRRDRESLKHIGQKLDKEAMVLEQAKDKAEGDLQDHISKTANEMDVIRDRVDELERQLAASKQEAADNADTANSDLGTMTTKYENLLSTHTALGKELAQQQKICNKDVEILRSQLRAASELLDQNRAVEQAHEQAQVSAQELIMAKSALREALITLQKEQSARLAMSLRYERQAVDLQALLFKDRQTDKEPAKLRKEWEVVCGTKKISLVNGDLIHGEVRFSQAHMEQACEIIRRSEPGNPFLEHFIGKIKKPSLEYEDYPKPASKISDVNKLHVELEKKSTVSFIAACFLARRWAIMERKDVLNCIRIHPLFRRSDLKTRLHIQQTGIEFFDRQFTFQIGRLVGCPVRHVNGLPAMFMVVGGSEDLANYEGQQLRLGSYKVAEVEEMNRKTWKILTE